MRRCRIPSSRTRSGATQSSGFTNFETEPVSPLVLSADGRYLYFDNGWSADPAIYRLRMADQKVEQMLTLKKFRRVLWGYLPWFGLTPNSEVLLMRDIGSQEVYALDFDSHD